MKTRGRIIITKNNNKNNRESIFQKYIEEKIVRTNLLYRKLCYIKTKYKTPMPMWS